jgi:hypothetical protein
MVFAADMPGDMRAAVEALRALARGGKTEK